jgi:beta-glucosidase
MEAWIDHPNITAVVWANLGSTEPGNALVDVMYGVQSPFGRLPYTIAKSPSDYPALPVSPLPDDDAMFNITYSEG